MIIQNTIRIIDCYPMEFKIRSVIENEIEFMGRGLWRMEIAFPLESERSQLTHPSTSKVQKRNPRLPQRRNRRNPRSLSPALRNPRSAMHQPRARYPPGYGSGGGGGAGRGGGGGNGGGGGGGGGNHNYYGRNPQQHHYHQQQQQQQPQQPQHSHRNSSYQQQWLRRDQAPAVAGAASGNAVAKTAPQLDAIGSRYWFLLLFISPLVNHSCRLCLELWRSLGFVLCFVRSHAGCWSDFGCFIVYVTSTIISC